MKLYKKILSGVISIEMLRYLKQKKNIKYLQSQRTDLSPEFDKNEYFEFVMQEMETIIAIDPSLAKTTISNCFISSIYNA